MKVLPEDVYSLIYAYLLTTNPKLASRLCKKLSLSLDPPNPLSEYGLAAIIQAFISATPALKKAMHKYHKQATKAFSRAY